MKIHPILFCLLPSLIVFADEREPFRIPDARVLQDRTVLRPVVTQEAIAITRPGELRLSVDLGATPEEEQEVFISRDGAWHRESAPIREIEGVRSRTVREDELYIVRAGEALTVPRLTAERNYLPGVVLQSRRSQPGAPPEVIRGELFVHPTQMPLRWDAERNAYVSKLLVGLDSENNEIPLDTAITVRFITRASVVQPETIELTRTGVEGYREVDLLCLDRDQIPRITVRSDLGEVHYEEIDLDVRFGGLEITSGEDRILGFGLGTTNLRVHRVAEDGRLLSNGSPATVQLTAQGGGKFDPDSMVTIPSGASAATVELRSRGVGQRMILASAGPVEGSVPIRFTFPIGFFAATLLGGAAGGFLKSLRKGEQSEKRSAPLMLEGCVMGLVAVAAVTAGLVIGDFPLPAIGTEVGAFLVAAASGYYGAPLMDRIVNTVFKTKPGTV